MLREDYLQQSAFHEVDTFATMKKQNLMLDCILHFHNRTLSAIDAGVQLKEIEKMEVREKISRMKEIPEAEVENKIKKINETVDGEFDRMVKAVGREEQEGK